MYEPTCTLLLQFVRVIRRGSSNYRLGSMIVSYCRTTRDFVTILFYHGNSYN